MRSVCFRSRNCGDSIIARVLKTTPIQLPCTLARRAGTHGCVLIKSVLCKEVLARAISLSAIRMCPLFGVSAIREFFKYGMYGEKQLVHSVLSVIR